MKYVFPLIILVTFFCPKNLYASPQVPDYLIYQGDTFPIYRLLVEEFIEKTGAEDNDSLFDLKFREGVATNCWRGYQAIFVVEKDTLFLDNMIYAGELEMDTLDLGSSKAKMKSLFKNRLANGRVHANWVSDGIFLPIKGLLRWDGVFVASFEHEIKLQIKKGIVKGELPIQNYIDDSDKINRRNSDEDEVIDTLFVLIETLDWEKLDECGCGESYWILVGKRGKVKKVEMAEYKREEIRKYWDRRDYNCCIRGIEKVIKKLAFDILKQNGNAIAEHIYLEVF